MTTPLEEKRGKVTLATRHRVGRGAHEEVEAVLLQKRQHVVNVFPGRRRFQTQLVQDIDAVKEHLEVLVFRQRVGAVVVVKGNEGAGPEPLCHRVIIRKLPQIHRRAADGKFHRQGRVDAQRNVRRLSGYGCQHQRLHLAGRNNVQVHPDTRCGGEVLVGHLLENDRPLAASSHPNVQGGAFRVVPLVAHTGIVLEEGAEHVHNGLPGSGRDGPLALGI